MKKAFMFWHSLAINITVLIIFGLYYMVPSIPFVFFSTSIIILPILIIIVTTKLKKKPLMVSVFRMVAGLDVIIKGIVSFTKDTHILNMYIFSVMFITMGIALIFVVAKSASKQSNLSFWKVFLFFLAKCVALAFAFSVLFEKDESSMIVGSVYLGSLFLFFIALMFVDYLLRRRNEPSPFSKDFKLE